MVHTVIYAYPFPTALPVDRSKPCCPAMLPREGKVPWACTRERGHDNYHQAGSLFSRNKMAEWSD